MCIDFKKQIRHLKADLFRPVFLQEGLMFKKWAALL